eukprot:TRINITY_DN1322_c0_g1_i1.p1 TRINITY_DN1322_c0_g1~~TRINITY_DN1322_c0_g1_i1.p1  ORF type:complete len:488 (+),score=90.69 TRINITY_DN1322_c0_g1_i1:123-1586(+)
MVQQCDPDADAPDGTGGCPWRYAFVLPQSITTALVMQGVPFCASVFSKPVKEARPSWPHNVVSHALSAMAVVMLITGFAWKSELRSGKKRGVRFWLGSGILVYQLGMCLCALSLSDAAPDSVWWLFAAGLSISCSASLGVVYAAGITHAVAHLGPGLGPSVFGGFVGLSATAWAPLISLLTTNLTLTQSFLIFAACPIPALACIPWVRLSKAPSGAAVGFARDPTITWQEIGRAPHFWLVVVTICGALLPGWGTISMYSNALQALGQISHAHAAGLTAAINAAYCTGRLVGGVLIHRAGAPRGFGALLVVECAAFASLVVSSGRSFPGCVIALCVAAACYGAAKVGIPALLVYVFGLRNFGVAFMWTGVSFMISSLTGPLISSHLEGTDPVLRENGPRNIEDNFFGLAALVCAVGVLASQALRPHPCRAVDDVWLCSPTASDQSGLLDGDGQGSEAGWVVVSAPGFLSPPDYAVAYDPAAGARAAIN